MWREGRERGGSKSTFADETYYVVFENWDNPKTAYGSGFFDIFAT